MCRTNYVGEYKEYDSSELLVDRTKHGLKGGLFTPDEQSKKKNT